jgi:hypothetical protein
LTEAASHAVYEDAQLGEGVLPNPFPKGVVAIPNVVQVEAQLPSIRLEGRSDLLQQDPGAEFCTYFTMGVGTAAVRNEADKVISGVVPTVEVLVVSSGVTVVPTYN